MSEVDTNTKLSMPSLTRVPSVGTFGWVRLSRLNSIVSDVALVTQAHRRADQERTILPMLTDQLISVQGASVGHQLRFVLKQLMA